MPKRLYETFVNTGLGVPPTGETFTHTKLETISILGLKTDGFKRGLHEVKCISAVFEGNKHKLIERKTDTHELMHFNTFENQRDNLSKYISAVMFLIWYLP